jgi:GNAT superfamily N-acetyltransferase
MNLERTSVLCRGVRLAVRVDGIEVGRVRLYILNNDLHDRPFGLGEDLYVEPSVRGHGYAREILRHLIEEAKSAGCYKLIVTSRHSHEHIHKMCTQAGFFEHGREFRIEFE